MVPLVDPFIAESVPDGPDASLSCVDAEGEAIWDLCVNCGLTPESGGL